MEPERVSAQGLELPLSNERSQTEIRIELFDAAEDLTRELKLAPSDEHGHPLLELIKLLLVAMEAEGADREHLWKGSAREPGLAYHFFKWDAQNQDELWSAPRRRPPTSSAAASRRLLGAAPERPPHEMGSWKSVLGERRRDTLLRLAGRLSAYIRPLVLAAIDESVRTWSAFATTTDPARRQELAVQEEPVQKDSIQDRLFRQGLLWRDLIRGERQPEDLLTNPRTSTPRHPPTYGKNCSSTGSRSTASKDRYSVGSPAPRC